jgi:protoheme IX farnesyltransferase
LLGVALLSGASSAAGLLGLLNILLYAGIYTPLKRISTWNTTVGSVVGAIPPLIGSLAADPSSLGNSSTYILPMVLFAWQFPHFNSLSWNLRDDYSKAGYFMLAALDPHGNSLATVKYSLFLFMVSFYAVYTGFVDSRLFLVDSSLLNAAFLYFSIQFHLNASQRSARRLFLFSLLYLPVFMMLLVMHKNPSRRAIQSFDEAHSRDSEEHEVVPCINPME